MKSIISYSALACLVICSGTVAAFPTKEDVISIDRSGVEAESQNQKIKVWVDGCFDMMHF